jgi:hypothetical protein
MSPVKLAAPQPARGIRLLDEVLTDALHFDLESLLTVEWEPAENKATANPNPAFVPSF